MHIKELVNKRTFDLLADGYIQKTELPLILVDPNGEIIYGRNRSCRVCDRLFKEKRRVLLKNCQLSRMKVVQEAYNYGEGYITTCPAGLIIFAVPLVNKKKLIAGLLSGFAIFPEMKKDIHEEIFANLSKYGGSLKKSILNHLNFKVLLLEEVRNHVSFLLMLTKRHSLNDIAFLKSRNEGYVQQEKIANFLVGLKKTHSDVARSILNKHEEIIQKVKLGDLTGAREILNEFMGSIFFESGMNFEVIKVRVIELIVVISRTAIESGAEPKELLGLNYSYLTDLNKVTDIEELLHKLAEILENFVKKVSALNEKKKNIELRQMVEFVRQNFKEKISSAQIAKVAGLSKSRASHLFHELTGSAPLEYIMKLRVDYAKHLLLNTNMRLTDVAIEIGFFDQSHFAKAFTKIENMTPFQFRQKYREGVPLKRMPF